MALFSRYRHGEGTKYTSLNGRDGERDKDEWEKEGEKGRDASTKFKKHDRVKYYGLLPAGGGTGAGGSGGYPGMHVLAL